MGARIGELISVFKNHTVQTITPVLALVHQGKGQYKAIIDRTALDMPITAHDATSQLTTQLSPVAWGI